MAVIINPESEYAKELAKWNKPYNPDAAENRYPRMLYMVRRRKDGVPAIGDPANEDFARSCQRVVRSDSEEQAAVNDGWRTSITLAFEQFERLERSVADAAAHRHYEERSMSDGAKREIEAAEAQNPLHTPEIPRTPVRRGRKPKAAQPQA